MTVAVTTLWDMPAKQCAFIDGLHADVSSDVASRLRQMGFNHGQFIQCLRRSPLKGPLVVQLGDCVYSLERQVAQLVSLRLAD